MWQEAPEKEGEWSSFLAGRVCVIALQANGLRGYVRLSKLVDLWDRTLRISLYINHTSKKKKKKDLGVDVRGVSVVHRSSSLGRTKTEFLSLGSHHQTPPPAEGLGRVVGA